ncbi:Ribosomal protein L11 methyltransferase (L11 Mtase) [Bradyrhizobium sp. STM 3843]|uniref:50S ribosomal protein L11 methyltransferase n=1 Tax=Bradyrhizobium sp. STM 3843 TaxID=551947 RepID=UPI00024071D7|nr:50S ribosomal protein L11 methyltransferase [Bradyrhizobium sp. STM 3843]CCE06703.1 Ribosomal protein L11 methyltransferase (L11 Mtase) [Bradyrhizobium sp. STM 3843]
MTSTLTPATHRASFSLAGETDARRAVDTLTEVFFEGDAAVAAFERPDGRWDVTVHFAQEPDRDLVRELVAGAAGADVAQTISFDVVEAKDWVKASLDDLVPVPAGRFVVHGSHDRARVPPNKLGIEIEAALAFGTGHHGTTRGCLLLFDHLLKSRSPRRVLDLGTGTGVLAIAAAKSCHAKSCRQSRHQPILASDIDPPSVAVARDNMRINGVAPRVRVIRATGFAAPDFAREGPFDLVLANILANPLRQLAGPMQRHLAPSAHVILSGLLTPQARAVVAAYRARGLVPVRQLRIDGWSSLLLRYEG